MIRTVTILAATAALTASTFAASAQTNPTGVWVNDERSTAVRVVRCGEALCGTVAWLREPRDKQGQPKVDRHNSNPKLRQRPLMGLPVLLGMKPSGENRWSGHIYNADDGRTYVSHIQMTSANAMQVQGCVLGGLICRKMNWARDTDGRYGAKKK